MRYNKDRYKNDNIVNNKYMTHIIQDIPESQKDTWLLSNFNMRLDLLSYKYYKTVDYWWLIAQANKLPADSIYIGVEGMLLRIPYIGD